MFTLQIQCATLDDAEQIIEALKSSHDRAVVEALAASERADTSVAMAGDAA
ncbi:hypothetical protein ACFPME_11155 [Rhodanobacter umsongensis]|uniref:GNAT family N-acetyltransferase n=1 Tax=Rhodanobacter umsongensis TaxID=633153 RepID=A0ABW0JM66_9GAMM